MSTSMEYPIYDNPEYYDIAFSWDLTKEARFYEACFRRYAEGPVKRLLELGCGTGRFLFEFARRGYQVHGLDINPRMVEYVKEKASKLRLPVRVTPADMADFQTGEEYDGALCAVNTFSYLLTEEQVRSHLTCVGRELRAGGVYFIDFDLLVRPEARPLGEGARSRQRRERWTMRRGQIRVKASFRFVGELDMARRRVAEEFILEGQDGEQRFRIEQRGEVRLNTLPDFLKLLKETAVFQIAAWYPPRFNPEETLRIEEPTDEPLRRVIVVLRRG